MTAPSAPSPLRAVFASVLRDVLVLVVGVTVVGAGVGYLVAGTPGLWGALVGAGFAAFFCLTTLVIMVRTADRPMHVTNAWATGAWLGKMLVLGVVLYLLRDLTFYDPRVLFVVLCVAVVGSLALEMRQVARARIPAVDLAQREGPSPSDGGGA